MFCWFSQRVFLSFFLRGTTQKVLCFTTSRWFSILICQEFVMWVGCILVHLKQLEWSLMEWYLSGIVWIYYLVLCQWNVTWRKDFVLIYLQVVQIIIGSTTYASMKVMPYKQSQTSASILLFTCFIKEKKIKSIKQALGIQNQYKILSSNNVILHSVYQKQLMHSQQLALHKYISLF